MSPAAALPLLSATTAPPAALLHSRGRLEPGIVHLGLGSFSRAHAAVFTAAAVAAEPGAWGVVGVARASTDVVDALHAQDLLSAVVEVGPGRPRVVVPAVHSAALVAAREREAVLAALAAPATRVVTLTLTEKGYTSGPGSMVALLAEGLAARVASGAGPVSVVSCDNVVRNGELTAALVREASAALPGAAEALAHLEEAVTFPSSVVDRIVPATTEATRALVERELGVRDAVPVPAEPYASWVLADAFAGPRPRWEAGGARVVDDVAPWEQVKLRLLNATHTHLALLGALAGCDAIADAVATDWLAEAARGLLAQDTVPTLAAPQGLDLRAHAASVLERFANPALGHRTRQVGSDTSAKLAQRVVPAALDRLAGGEVPSHLALTVAAFVACAAAGAGPLAGFDAGPHAAAMTEPARDLLTRLGAGASSPAALADAVCRRPELLGPELSGRDVFARRVGELLDVLVRRGPRAAVAEAAGTPGG